MASAICTVNNLSAPQNVAANTSFEIELASGAGSNSWTVTCIATDKSTTPAAINATLVTNNITKKATVTSQGLGSAYIFQSQLDLGQTDGQIDPAKTVTFAVFVLASNGNRVLVPGMTYEADATYGWTEIVNALMRTATTQIPGAGLFGQSTHAMASNADAASANDNAAGIVDVVHGTETGDFTLTFATPTVELVHLINNTTAFNCTLQIAAGGTSCTVGAGVSALVRFRTTGTQNAINGQAV